jgi:hypothetical protein
VTVLGVPFVAASSNSHVVLATTPHGGHLGWFEGVDAFVTKRRWVVRPALEFLGGVVDRNPKPRRHRGVEVVGVELDGFVVDKEKRNVGFKVVKEGEKFVGGENGGVMPELTAGL